MDKKNIDKACFIRQELRDLEFTENLFKRGTVRIENTPPGFEVTDLHSGDKVRLLHVDIVKCIQYGIDKRRDILDKEIETL